MYLNHPFGLTLSTPGLVLIYFPLSLLTGQKIVNISETLCKQKKEKKPRRFLRSVFQTLSPDKDKTEACMTKSLNAGTSEGEMEDEGAETLGDSDMPNIRVSNDTVTSTLTQTLS